MFSHLHYFLAKFYVLYFDTVNPLNISLLISVKGFPFKKFLQPNVYLRRDLVCTVFPSLNSKIGFILGITSN